MGRDGGAGEATTAVAASVASGAGKPFFGKVFDGLARGLSKLSR